MESPKLYSKDRAMKESLKIRKKVETGKVINYDEAEKIFEKEKSDLAELNASAEIERDERDEHIQAVNHRKNGMYDNHVYQTLEKIFREKDILTHAWKRKLLRFHKLPAEAKYIFEKLKAEHVSINDIPPDVLKKVLKRSFDLIDRKDDYDKDLAQQIGHLELLRWRNNESLKNGDSFKKIVATLRDHAVIKQPRTKIGQTPKVTFQPKGEYHKNESL